MWRRWCDGDDDDDNDDNDNDDDDDDNGFELRSRRSMEGSSVGLFEGRWDFGVVRLLIHCRFHLFPLFLSLDPEVETLKRREGIYEA